VAASKGILGAVAIQWLLREGQELETAAKKAVAQPPDREKLKKILADK
jgi:hypothetical protein